MDEATRGGPPPSEDAASMLLSADTADLAPARPSDPVPAAGYARGAAPVSRGTTPTWNSSTSELSPIELDQYLRARPRRRWWILAAAALVLLAAGGVTTAIILRAKQSSPAAAVRDYFADLANGDTMAALRLVDAADTFTPSTAPLLTPAALARSSDRPSGAKMVSTVATNLKDGRTATAVSVVYTLAGASALQTIPVVSAGGSYRLVSPFVTVTVAADPDRRVTVNTVPLPAGTGPTPAFPGVYAATEPGNQLLAASTATAAIASSSGAVAATITLPAPTVAPTAAATVQTAVNAALNACAASKSATPAHCPFRYDNDSGATMTWKITAYPKVELSVVNAAVTFSDSGHPGTVHYDAKTSTFFGLIPSTDSGTASVDVTGTAIASDTGVTVTFH
jgi:hypothetical protein